MLNPDAKKRVSNMILLMSIVVLLWAMRASDTMGNYNGLFMGALMPTLDDSGVRTDVIIYHPRSG